MAARVSAQAGAEPRGPATHSAGAAVDEPRLAAQLRAQRSTYWFVVGKVQAEVSGALLNGSRREQREFLSLHYILSIRSRLVAQRNFLMFFSLF